MKANEMVIKNGKQSIKKLIVNYVISGVCGKPENEMKGKREFTNDRDCEKFLARLNNIKIALAFRNIGEHFNKLSDCYKKSRYQTLHTPSNFSASKEFTAKGWQAAQKNPYKLSVNIQTIITPL